MKIAIALLFAFVAAASAAPTQITDNNVGDIVSVNVDADLKLDNKIDIDAAYINALYKNVQKILIGQGYDDDYYPNFPNLPQLPF